MGRLQNPRVRRPAAEVARRALAQVADGAFAGLPLSLRFWDGSVLAAGGGGMSDAPTVVLTRPRALAHLLREPGELGLVRAYVDGSLRAEGELEALLSLRGRMRASHLTPGDRRRIAVAAVQAGGPRVLRRPPIPAIEARIDGERHSGGRDAAAIRHHYDVSNDFYRLVLGPSLVYSCAYYADPADSLLSAQTRKLDLICRKLDLRAGERLLDIGCGWGSLVLHAAEHYGVRATGITLSPAQAALARERVAAAGLADRVRIEVADYRDLGAERFQKIASVGMYEHVGRAELGRYARTAMHLLEPGGLMLNHGIAMLDDAPADPKTLIARYIFPDGELHPVAELMSALQATGMEVRDVESLREHYPLTLRAWLANLRENWDHAQELAGPERTRTWELYMLGSALGFEAGAIGVYQVLAARLDGPHHLPLTRERMLVGDARGPAAPAPVRGPGDAVRTA